MKSSMLDQLLNQLRLRGLTVEYAGDDQLKLVGPKGEANPSVLAAVKAFKPDLLDRLRPREAPRSEVHHPPAAPGPLDGPDNCVKCHTHVWDREETGMICDTNGCPYRGATGG